MNGIGKARMGITLVLAVALVSITRRLPEARRLSSGITTLALVGIVLLVAAGSASAAPCSDAIGGPGSCNCGDTVVGDYTFNANMACPAGSPGLIIGAPNIIINGAGFAMIGSKVADGCTFDVNGGAAVACNNPAMHSGIVNNGDFDGVWIHDLEIMDFCTGIALGSSTSTNIDSNDVTNCSVHDNGIPAAKTHGIQMVETNDCLIKCNSVIQNDGTGPAAGVTGGGNGIHVYGNWMDERGSFNDFRCNKLLHNTKSGLFMRNGPSFNYIGYNYAEANGEHGIAPRCTDSTSNTIDRNNATYNAQHGIYVQGSTNDIINNTAIDNMGDGIRIGLQPGNVVDDNCACGNLAMDINNLGGIVRNVDNTCNNWVGGVPGPGAGCQWNCDDLIPVYYNFDNDWWGGQPWYSGLFGPCDNLMSVGVGNNPGLFSGAGAPTHCGKIDSCSGAPQCKVGVAGGDPFDCVPELATFALVGAGLMTIVGLMRFRRRKR